jgi:hypothetical protein
MIMTCPIWLGPRYESQKIIELTRAASARERISYEHHHRHAEPMLAIPDAIAWCWSKGGIWRRRIRPIVSDVMKVQAAQIARSPSATVVRPGLGLTSWSSTLQMTPVSTNLRTPFNRTWSVPPINNVGSPASMVAPSSRYRQDPAMQALTIHEFAR